MQRVGILGGTFDPPHCGHLLIAQEVMFKKGLDQIWFLPSNIPPHKERAVSSGEDRINMVNLAVENNQSFHVNTIEFERDEPSYTVETIKILKERYPLSQFYFIIGADMVEYLPKWHKIDELLREITFIGVKREGFTLETPYPIEEIEVPFFEVSSSFLRMRSKKKGNLKYFVPEKVKKYIEEKNLYG